MLDIATLWLNRGQLYKGLKETTTAYTNDEVHNVHVTTSTSTSNYNDKLLGDMRVSAWYCILGSRKIPKAVLPRSPGIRVSALRPRGYAGGAISF